MLRKRPPLRFLHRHVGERQHTLIFSEFAFLGPNLYNKVNKIVKIYNLNNNQYKRTLKRLSLTLCDNETDYLLSVV